MNPIIRMLTRMFMQRGINAGINHGSRFLAGRGKSEQDMTPAERASAKKMKANARNARKALRMGRRLR